MSKKKNPLTEGLEARKSAQENNGNGEAKTAATRSGRALVAGHFAIEVQRMLRIIAAEESTTVQALLAEGLNYVFAKRGKPQIAAATNAQPKAAPAEEVGSA